jgi:hypothetical protein
MQYRTLALLGAACLIGSDLGLAAEKTPATPAPKAASAAQSKPSGLRPKLVDINSASRAELKTLPGIGDAEADKIIANRPYLTKSSLVSKKVLALGPYDALRGRIIAVQPLEPVQPVPPKAKP